METRHGFKYRQLHIEDYLREIPAEQGRVTGVYAHEWIAKRTRFAWKPGTKTTEPPWYRTVCQVVWKGD